MALFCSCTAAACRFSFFEVAFAAAAEEARSGNPDAAGNIVSAKPGRSLEANGGRVSGARSAARP
eukprot:6104700-Alexandrium_andersonii.AAC.1